MKKMIQPKRITCDHLVAALSVGWSTRTCLVAQALGGRSKVDSCGAAIANMADGSRLFWGEAHNASDVAAIQAQFDMIRHTSPSQQAVAVAKIAAKLPIQFDAEVRPFVGSKFVEVNAETLKAATSQPWSTTSCLIATALGGREVLQGCGDDGANTHAGQRIVFDNQKVRAAQSMFDTAYGPKGEGVGDSNKSEMRRELEAMLPFVFEAHYVQPAGY